MSRQKVVEHASKYYDPVKAHEYYMRTRELKGRKTSDFSDKQKEGWAYAKDQVKEDEKTVLKKSSETYKAQLEEIRNEAIKRREEISDKIHKIMEQLTKEATDTRKSIQDKVNAEIDALPDIPKGLTKEQRAEFSAKRKEEIAKIRGEATGKRNDVNVWTKGRRDAEQETVKTQRKEAATQLKGILDKARKDYEQAREVIKAEFEGVLANEYSNIANMAGESKPKKRKKR